MRRSKCQWYWQDARMMPMGPYPSENKAARCARIASCLSSKPMTFLARKLCWHDVVPDVSDVIAMLKNGPFERVSFENGPVPGKPYTTSEGELEQLIAWWVKKHLRSDKLVVIGEARLVEFDRQVVSL